ncbi:kinase-like domain-containing protein [Aspergillus keveii]|uniref:Kinase-like domain-containing protein n=1 Tax=Aspergillus keveii TaxID=714993 RepID=A0ABR4G227_9EURO
MAGAAGLPVPKVICCGEHINNFQKVSILMTRLPGIELYNVTNSDDVVQPEDDEDPWLEELRTCVSSMRCWQSSWPEAVCSPLGTQIKSSRVPDHVMGPFFNLDDFYRYLLGPSSSRTFESKVEYEETVLRAKKLQKDHQRIVFTHGDLKAHNILVNDDGHLSNFLDWESRGWYPEYWEFTTAMRFERNGWWFQLDSDRAVNNLTVNSYIFLVTRGDAT